MTVIKSRPGIEVTILRYDGRKHLNAAVEYENPKIKDKIHPFSSFRGFKCEEGQEFGIQLLVNADYLELPDPDDEDGNEEVRSNSAYNLACDVYIKGVREAQFRLRSNAMPGKARSKVYQVGFKARKPRKEQLYFIQPEQDLPPADVQIQLRRLYTKGFGWTMKEEQKEQENSRGYQVARRSCNKGAGDNGKNSRQSGFRTKYIDEPDNPFAIFRFMYLVDGDAQQLGMKKVKSISRVLLPRNVAHVDLTQDEEPVIFPEMVDLTCIESSDEEEEEDMIEDIEPISRKSSSADGLSTKRKRPSAQNDESTAARKRRNHGKGQAVRRSAPRSEPQNVNASTRNNDNKYGHPKSPASPPSVNDSSVPDTTHDESSVIAPAPEPAESTTAAVLAHGGDDSVTQSPKRGKLVADPLLDQSNQLNTDILSQIADLGDTALQSCVDESSTQESTHASDVGQPDTLDEPVLAANNNVQTASEANDAVSQREDSGVVNHELPQEESQTQCPDTADAEAITMGNTVTDSTVDEDACGSGLSSVVDASEHKG